MSTDTLTETTTRRSLFGAAWMLALVPLLLLGLHRPHRRWSVRAGRSPRRVDYHPAHHAARAGRDAGGGGQRRAAAGDDPQVLVDEAYWAFEATPSNTIPRLGRATFTIPYPWVEEEAHAITLITELGATFEGEVPVAVETPAPSLALFARLGLVGFYVGVIPVLLGVLWYPFMRRLGRQGMDFILALTVGLLVYLAVGTWLDAVEFAEALPAFWQVDRDSPTRAYLTIPHLQDTAQRKWQRWVITVSARSTSIRSTQYSRRSTLLRRTNPKWRWTATSSTSCSQTG